MDKWLQEFSYRTNIKLSTFLFSVLIILLILALAVGRQTLKSAFTNPVDAVKYEWDILPSMCEVLAFDFNPNSTQ